MVGSDRCETSGAQAEPHELHKETKPTHRAWWLQWVLRRVRDTLDRQYFVLLSMAAMRSRHEQVSDSGIKGCCHLIVKPMRKQLAFERLRADEHSRAVHAVHVGNILQLGQVPR